MNTEQKLSEALKLYLKAGLGQSTDYFAQAQAYSMAKQALAAESEQLAGPEKLELLPISDELLEQLFWEFDAARKQTDERFAFKGKLRWVDAKAKSQKITPLARLNNEEIQQAFMLSVAPFDIYRTGIDFANAVMDAMIKKNGG